MLGNVGALIQMNVKTSSWQETREWNTHKESEKSSVRK